MLSQKDNIVRYSDVTNCQNFEETNIKFNNMNTSEIPLFSKLGSYEKYGSDNHNNSFECKANEPK